MGNTQFYFFLLVDFLVNSYSWRHECSSVFGVWLSEFGTIHLNKDYINNSFMLALVGLCLFSAMTQL